MDLTTRYLGFLAHGIPMTRPLDKKMGTALARRTIFRPSDVENWSLVATRVALGNCSLVESAKDDFELMRNKLAAAEILMSGRHLQHGDVNQPERNMEVFTNCSTAATSFLLFYLLLNGSGVGRSYDDAIVLVDWDKAPALTQICTITHPDYDPEVFLPAEGDYFEAVRKGQLASHIYYRVPDSREGWAKAAELYERLTFENTNGEKVLVLDWSDVRPKGSPIGGMQNRPASGPVPTARAFQSISQVKGAGLSKWKQAMFVDHYLAECVVVGGARRSARMATKHWKDPGAIEFAEIKKHYGLWSSNNSIIVDAEFYEHLEVEGSWANQVFKAVTEAAYHDGTGEPGIINVHNFAPETVDWDLYADGRFADSFKFSVDEPSLGYMKELVIAAGKMSYHFITNPCGEIKLLLLGGYCVIADVVPFHSETLEDALVSFEVATRALIRVNTMRSLYDREVKRTNRIGVGFTGIHEFAFKFFGIGFREMLDEFGAAREFWQFMARASRAVKLEARRYALELGVAIPATDTTVKPAGSTSKLYALSEGAHLPSMREYLRWVQFLTGDPLIAMYADKGYPVRELVSYKQTTIVGFPTQPTICKLGMGDKLVTAPEATPEEQYQYLMLLEKYWITGVDETGHPLPDTGNQVSYTLKYDPKKVDFEQFVRMMREYQSKIKCCSVMPAVDTTAYEYQPEEPIGRGRFLYIIENLKDEDAKEDIDMESLACASGICPL